MSSNHEPSRCPNCKNVEATKVVCIHCDYEYTESEATTGQNIMVGLIVLTGLFIFITLLIWILDKTVGHHTTDLSYVEFVWKVLKNAWGLVKDLV